MINYRQVNKHAVFLKSKKTFFHICIALFVLVTLGTHKGWAQYDIPPVPEKQTSLYDYINLLNPSQKSALESKLLRYADSTSTQIVVAIIDSSNGEGLDMLGAKWGQKWGIGQADKDNGILILLAKGDRKIDINTGYGIEYRITDRDAERIINRVMIPSFKNNDFYGGLDKGADAIFASLQGEFTEDREFKKEKEFPIGVILFIIFVIIFIALSARKNDGNHNGGNRRRGTSLLDVIILSNMGRTGGFGGGGGSFGGGGFGGGFGGGGFGGGGASGGW